jgi:hypothetical protein
MGLNGDGGVSILDFPTFAERFGVQIVFPGTGLAADLGVAQSLIIDRSADARRLPTDRRLDFATVGLTHDAALLSFLAQWNDRLQHDRVVDLPRRTETELVDQLKQVTAVIEE